MAPTDAEYVRIAGELRDAITAGRYGEGEQLPTLRELSDHYGVSQVTVRKAIALLRDEGLVESRTRLGTRVRPRPPVHRLQADRYRSAPVPSTPFTRDQGVTWSEYRLDKRFERVAADEVLAGLFACTPGEPLLARHFVFYSNDEPSQMSTSYVRWSDVGGTPVADPIYEPWPGGTRAQLLTLGIRVARVEEALTGGMPTDAETRTLHLGKGVPVLRFTRKHVADDGRVVEVAHPIVRRADTTVVEYVIPIEE
ncbi:GntR family transcriptional regulator [Streptomyces sp. NPDC092046]|uniref:GntR family transcriptional regulator n=1 Tax=Streptomyces sp. NPDC092046 TaxID=3366009 RepID=UPI0037F246F4